MKGTVLSLKLRTANLEQAVRFYEQLGMQIVDEDAGTCVSLGYPGGPQTTLTLQQSEQALDGAQLPSGYDHLVIATEDLQEATAALDKMGTKVLMPPTKMFGMNIAGFADSDGYKLYLILESDFRQS